MTFVEFVTSHKLQNTLSTHVHFGFRQRFSASQDGRNMTPKCSIHYETNTGLFEMIVGVLTTCHTQYT